MITTGTIYQDLHQIIEKALKDRVVMGLNNYPAFTVYNNHRNLISQDGKPAIYFFNLNVGRTLHKAWGQITKEVTFNVGTKRFNPMDEYFYPQISELMKMFAPETWMVMPYNFTVNGTQVNRLGDIGVKGCSHGDLIEFYDDDGRLKGYVSEMFVSMNFTFNYNELN